MQMRPGHSYIMCVDVCFYLRASMCDYVCMYLRLHIDMLMEKLKGVIKSSTFLSDTQLAVFQCKMIVSVINKKHFKAIILLC